MSVSMASRGWPRVELRRLVRTRGGMTPSKAEPAFWEGEVPWISPKDMKRFRLSGSIDTITEAAVIRTGIDLIAPGAVLMVTRGMILDHTVPVALNDVPVTLNQDMKALLPEGRLLSGFLAWSLLGHQDELLARVEVAGHGTCALRTEQWGALPFPLPPKAEQTQIARFLDYETAKIDRLIEKQQLLIALLKEKRQAVISHAVTKGLNRDAPMKDSGVEWLGQVPAHWAVARVKQVAKMDSGHTPSRKVEEYWIDCTIPWVSLNDTKQMKVVDRIYDTAICINERGMANSSAHLLPPGCVVFTRDATIGLAAITGRAMAVSQHIIAWICDPSKVVKEYLLLVFYAMEKELERFTFGATLKTIGMPDVSKLTGAFPPIEEQKRIVEHVFAKMDRFLQSIAKAEEMLELLSERRTALISAAVTGKIDVRTWTPPEAA